MVLAANARRDVVAQGEERAGFGLVVGHPSGATDKNLNVGSQEVALGS